MSLALICDIHWGIEDSLLSGKRIPILAWNESGFRYYHRIGRRARLAEEIALTSKLADQKVDLILFSNRELETYEPYESYKREDLVDQYPSTLQAMAWNSAKIYLRR